jgi:hypothetical protein
MESSPRLRVTPAPATSHNSREPEGCAWIRGVGDLTASRLNADGRNLYVASDAGPTAFALNDSNRERRATRCSTIYSTIARLSPKRWPWEGQQAAVRRPMSHTPATDEERASRPGVGSLMLAVPAEVATNSSRRRASH